MKPSDLVNFEEYTPLEMLGWAREEMQGNFQQPMSARTIRACTVCSERWDTAEDGGDGYRWVVCGNNKKNIHAGDTTSHGEKKKGLTKKREENKRCRVSNSRTLTG